MISFIIPTLNEEKVLEQTLRDLRKYSEPYEIVVSDGGSTDGTIAIAQQLANRVVVYREARRQTIGQGRNLGAAVARGEFLVFLDADVHIPDPNTFFAHALELFRTESNLVGIVPQIRVFPEMENFGDRFLSWLIIVLNVIQNNWLHIGAGPGEFQMVRAASFRAIHGYDKRLVTTEDFEFMRRLARQGRTRYVHSLIVFHPGRRAHATGWFKLLCIWTLNTITAILFRNAVSREWKEIR